MPAPFRQIFTARSNILLFLLVFCLMGLTACGYKTAAFSPSILGDGSKTLKIKEVDSPTLDVWLPHAIRSSLRNEVNARHLARWVDDGPADYEISIKITAFTQREGIHDRYDNPLLYDNRLEVVATVYDGATNKEIWRSGSIAYSDRDQNAVDTRTSADAIVNRTMYLVADALRNTF